MGKNTICIKIGGKAASESEALEALISDIRSLQESHSFILIHGGGAEVTKISKIFGIEPVFKNGIRQTSSSEMEIVEMVLSGKMNKQLVRMFNSRGVKSCGLCVRTGRYSQVKGLIPDIHRQDHSCEKGLLDLVVQAGFMPVISSTSMDSKEMR